MFEGKVTALLYCCKQKLSGCWIVRGQAVKYMTKQHTWLLKDMQLNFINSPSLLQMSVQRIDCCAPESCDMFTAVFVIVIYLMIFVHVSILI